MSLSKERVTFRKLAAEEVAENYMIQEVLYTLDGISDSYTAEGEDIQDLERDWAYKYLELLES